MAFRPACPRSHSRRLEKAVLLAQGAEGAEVRDGECDAELRDYAERAWESDELRSRALVEAHTKIANILVRFDHLMSEAAENGRTVQGVETMRSQVREIQQSMLRRI